MTSGHVFCGACGTRLGVKVGSCARCGEPQQPLQDQRPTAPDLEVVAPGADDCAERDG
jgi:hypothetical protein